MSYLITGKEYLAQSQDFRLVGREDELDRLMAILVRSQSSSVILSGARGVGCESLCKGIQDSKKNPDAPFDIVSKRLFWLDINGLYSSGDSADINAQFQKIMRRLERTTNTVMIVEDTRDFLDGARNFGCSHFVNAIISAVQHNKSQFILIASDDDLEYVLKAHNDLRESFTIMTIDEPTGDILTAIVTDSAQRLSRHHRIRVEPAAISTAIKLTAKVTYDAGLSSAQPERSIILLDRALADYRLESHSVPPQGVNETEWLSYQKKLHELYREQRDGEDAIAGLEEEIADLKEEEDKTAPIASESSTSANAFERATAIGGMETAAIGERRRKIKIFQTEVEKTKAEFDRITAILNEKLELGDDQVIAAFSDITGIPKSKLLQNDRERLRGLEDNLKKRIYGQDRVVAKLSDAVKVARAGKRRDGTPQTAFLFLGPSGTGKTELAKALAAILLEDERALTRFDMSEYMEKHAVATLIGAPPGYEGFEVGGLLTNLARKNGRRIYLFDEIEKAHPDVFNIFLQILSDGRLTDRVGRTVSFEDAIILMTTNIGQPHFLDQSLTFAEAEALTMIDLNSTYKAELLNRFAGRQNIICFERLGLESIERIVRREINKLDDAYAESGLRVAISNESLTSFCIAKYDPKIGARGMPGLIKANIEPVIVNSLIDFPEKHGTFRITYEHDNLDVKLEAT